MSFNPWEIWWAWVKFDDIDEIKRRPVLITDQMEACIIAWKVTSRESRDNYMEYEIIRWKSAGLDKPSTIRMGQILKLREEDMDQKIGELDIVDIVRIQRKLMV